MKGSKKMMGKMMPAFMKKGAEMDGMKSKPKTKKYARGGGIESRGKTRGKMC